MTKRNDSSHAVYSFSVLAIRGAKSHIGSLFSRSCSCQFYQFVWVESRPLPNSMQISFGERSFRGPLPIAEAQAEGTRTSLSLYVASIWAYDPCLLGTCISTKWGGERYFILLVGGRIPPQAVKSCLEMVMVLPVSCCMPVQVPLLFSLLLPASRPAMLASYQFCEISHLGLHTHTDPIILFFLQTNKYLLLS